MNDSRQQQNINIWIPNQRKGGIQVRTASLTWISVPDTGHVAIPTVGGREDESDRVRIDAFVRPDKDISQHCGQFMLCESS